MCTQECKILHISSHFGGGVGRSMIRYFSSDKNSNFNHTVVLLGYAIEDIIKPIEDLNIILHENMFDKCDEVIDMIPNFDIVVIHYWNHPLILDFLIRNKLPPCRVIMLGHNSGFHPPNIYTKKILLYPDIFVFTTPISFDIEEMKELDIHYTSIWSTADLDNYKDIKVKKHKGFNIGYVGTVDYAKIHPDFLEMCKEIIDLDIPNVKFIVVGGLKQAEIQKQAVDMGIGDKFVFTGWVNDLTLYYEIFDVFGYPLAPYHYGTCDLVLQLAMASGVVPVVLDNKMEKYMIQNNKTGIIAKNKESYVQGIKDLYNNINWRKELSNNTRSYAISMFSEEKLVSGWKEVFNEVLPCSKSVKEWNIDKNEIEGIDIFLESLGDYAKLFDSPKEIDKLAKESAWQTETKGSVHNYSAYFPEDKLLKKLSKMMKK